jgi:hypothetical protein
MKKILPIIIVALLVGGISFYGGTVFAKRQTPAQSSTRQGGTGASGRTFGGQGRNGGGFVSGKVVSKDATSITIQLDAPANGQTGSGTTGSKIVFYSASTTVSQTTQGTMDAVTNGAEVTVIGQTGADGSVTAQSIQIRPAGMPFGRGGLPAQGQGGQPNGQ